MSTDLEFTMASVVDGVNVPVEGAIAEYVPQEQALPPPGLPQTPIDMGPMVTFMFQQMQALQRCHQPCGPQRTPQMSWAKCSKS